MRKSISINTAQLAGMLKISEGFLVHAMQTVGHLHGVPFPLTINHHKAHSRKFNLDDAIKFADKVNSLKENGNYKDPKLNYLSNIKQVTDDTSDMGNLSAYMVESFFNNEF